MNLIRRDNEQIDAFIDEMVNLCNLRLVVIIRRSKLKGYIFVNLAGHLQLLVLLFTPNITTTLRDPYLELLLNITRKAAQNNK